MLYSNWLIGNDQYRGMENIVVGQVKMKRGIVCHKQKMGYFMDGILF